MTSKFDRVRDGAEIEPNLNEWAIQQVMNRVYDESYPIAWLLHQLRPDARTWVSVCTLLEHPHPSSRFMANRCLGKVARNLPVLRFVVALRMVQEQISHDMIDVSGFMYRPSSKRRPNGWYSRKICWLVRGACHMLRSLPALIEVVSVFPVSQK